MSEAPKLLEGPSCMKCKPACCEDVGLIVHEEEFDIVVYGREDSDEDPIDRENEIPITKIVDSGKLIKKRAEGGFASARGRDPREVITIIGRCGNLISVVDPKTGQSFLGCRFHGKREQPLVCSGGFPKGGYGCLKFRAERLRSIE